MTELAFIVAAGFWRRWLGGWLGSPRPVCVAAGFPLAFLAAWTGADPATVLAWLYAAALAALVVGGILPSPHGVYMDPFDRKPENSRLAPLLRRLFPPALWYGPAYKITGLALRYSLVSVPVGVLIASPVYCLGGVFIAAAYTGFAWLKPRGVGGPFDGWASYPEFLIGAWLVGGLSA